VSRPIRILVSGSRDWKDRPTIALAISSYLRSVGTSIGGAYPFPVVIHGAARGADRLADEIALGWGWTPERHPVTPADWDQFGKAAGHRRNRLMVELGADVLLAFPLGEKGHSWVHEARACSRYPGAGPAQVDRTNRRSEPLMMLNVLDTVLDGVTEDDVQRAEWSETDDE